MYIGASPGSTGGGIKTTTFAVMILAILAMVRGSSDITAYRRRIPLYHIREVLSLVGISILFISLLVYILMLFEPFPFVKLMFEAFSAFGTVGLSMGITSFLSVPGKAIIIILMYLGRIGPLTLVFAMSQRKRKFHLQYTEERIGIG
jgi:trk system potassium uptake protein TrkH